MSARPIADAPARAAALDPRRSCIVQAPAGSGKTGLLIQRYLTLLAGVERPEEVLAITFTKKAAAEMRRRVLQALEAANAGAPPKDDNQALTRRLAAEVLARDAQRGWSLRENAARLRIQTIDSLCASLARQMPVLSRLGAPPAIVDDPQDLLREAAERTLLLVESPGEAGEAVAGLLRHLDGDWNATRDILQAMLARRDQWMRLAHVPVDTAAREALEGAFVAERSRMLRRLHAVLPAAEHAELVALANYAAQRVVAAKPHSPIRELAGLAAIPAPDETGAARWCAMAELLLTREAKFRERLDRNVGFPPGKGEERAFTQRMGALLDRLRGHGALCEAFHAVRGMPPARFTQEQWAVLGSMLAVLRLAAAQLDVVFAERGAIDFTGLAQAAVRALGEPDAPTDLLLALDLRLSHLLVDEFQDTSASQWALLERLTAGWLADDGRTVFLVGDPMQSIYRFREADVALFLRAQREGLPSVALEALRLETNFRSREGVVAWVNGAFRAIFPSEDAAESGAVRYSESVAFHPPGPEPAVEWGAFVADEIDLARAAEAQRVVQLAQAALADPSGGSLAVLVRTRSHLDRIVPALQAAGIAFRAVDIEPLGGRVVVQELLALARALAHPADRVAWLALLRAPWAAFTDRELHDLAGDDGGRRTLWALLQDEARLARLPAAARGRAERLREALRPGVEGRMRGSLGRRVEAAWLALGGPAACAGPADLDDAETFFEQLEALEDAGDVPDPLALEERLAALHGAPEAGEGTRLQLMTIHKAKGLEFDTVIVPGLDRAPRATDKPLFAWRSRADGALLMAPVRAAGEAVEPAYDYLMALDEEAADQESRRLFYVAATRAIHRLHLLGCAKVGAKGLRAPEKGSLLSRAWSVAHEAFGAARPIVAPAPQEAARARPPGLRRLDDRVHALVVDVLDASLAAPLPEEPPRVEFSWAGETARHVGTVTHRWLQRIGQEGLDRWNADRIGRLGPAVASALAGQGVPAPERDLAVQSVLRALAATIADVRGRWILGPHPESRFEYRLRMDTPAGVRAMAIDRLFTDARGDRWIVDYKTSPHGGGDLEAFLDREVDRYRDQLERYARALGPGPVKLGLYFPLTGGWRSWEPATP